MIGFIKFLESKSEERKNLDKTLAKLPKNHQELLASFDITFTCKNTLDNDRDHIGSIFKYDIKISAPWNYGREFTTLHEVAHLVYEKLVTKDDKKVWKKLCKKYYKSKPKMNCEELFCMVYANVYSKHKVETYNIEKLMNFIKNL